MDHNPNYIEKDHWMVCDRCGGDYRRSDMREHWTGQWLCTFYCWEKRHPQDLIKGIPDNPRADVIRTAPPIDSGETTLNGALVQYAIAATLTTASGLSDKDPVGINMDNNATHWTFIVGDPVGNDIVLNDPISYKAASGNSVALPSINNL